MHDAAHIKAAGSPFYGLRAFILPRNRQSAMKTTMGSKFGCLAQNVYVLQDHKRLPARFFARISGALNSRLRLA
ncbi:conserved hypothetical protein [Agrobacterium fabacearum CFBP 5771]|nr:conserved hypothetical protein [Agrobacterium fabacearum CFBP 5771]